MLGAADMFAEFTGERTLRSGEGTSLQRSVGFIPPAGQRLGRSDGQNHLARRHAFCNMLLHDTGAMSI
jgi:hypothetical protein